MSNSSLPAHDGYLQPVHRIPGRVRFKVQGLYRTRSMQRRLEACLARLDGVRNAQANVRTGSLVVYFDPVLPLAELIAAIERELTDLPAVSRPAGQGNRPAQDDRPWHALAWEAVLAELETDRQGLSSPAAQARLARYGPNALPQAERRSDLSLLLGQLMSAPVALLGISATVSVATGGLMEAVAIGSVVIINTLIGFVTERQSERTIAALTQTEVRLASVRRDNAWRDLPTDQVVPGDIIALAPGSFIAADARLLEAERLSLDESALTGESLPVEKQADVLCPEEAPLAERHNRVYMGTLVTGGSGSGIVVGTGPNTEIGRIQSLAAGARPPATPMEQQLNELSTRLVWLSSAICVGVFGIGLLRGYGWLEMLRASISLAVAAVPEGLPMVATTTLALGVRDMQRRKVLVRQIDAVETLGAVQFFCFDKTGTLTLNRMVVVEVHTGGQRIRVDGERFYQDDHPLEPPLSEELLRLCEAVALCNEIELDGNNGSPQLNGSSTEKALVELALQAGVDVENLRRRHPRLSLQHRAQDRPYMVSVHQGNSEQDCRVALKGSPEQVLALCRHALCDGQRLPLDEELRTRILGENERMAGAALRVLGVAYAEGCSPEAPLEELVWLGLTGMADPVRPEMDVLFRRLHRAGIKTAMITGDQSATAQAIGEQLNLAEGEPLDILDADSLDQVDPDQLSERVQQVQVFARVSPAHKLQIVQALQQARKVVAMTGDGVNDGPALRAADLGVAMGGGGTEVARSLADIVLEDDDLKTMEVAVRQGRTIYDNVRKSIRFLVSTNLSEIEVMLAGIGLGLGQPLNPMQLLWINLLTDIFPGLALALEAPESDVMERPPRDPRTPVIDQRDLRRLGIESAVISGGTLASYGYAFLRYGPGPKASTHAFMSLTLAQLLHALSNRSERRTLLEQHRLPANPYLSGALGVSLLTQLLTVLVPGLRRLLGTAPLGLTDTLVVGAGAVTPLLINDLTKKIATRQPPPSA